MSDNERLEPEEGRKPSEPKGCCKPSKCKRCYELPSGGWVKFRQWPLLRPLKLKTRYRLFGACRRRLWKLADDWRVVLCGMPCTKRKVPDGKIVIPKGTITDGASVPQPWLVSFLTFGFLRPTGILLIPSIVHDYAYEHGCLRYRNEDGTETCREISRGDADWLFREMIRGISHTWLWACVAWLAVRAGWLLRVKYAGKRIGWKTPFKELACSFLALIVLVAALCVLVAALCVLVAAPCCVDFPLSLTLDVGTCAST